MSWAAPQLAIGRQQAVFEIGLQWLHDEYSRPIYGDHNPLVLDWSDDQLEPIVGLLQPRLPVGLTTRMKYAIASCALSLVTEKKVSGNALHYARARDAYRLPKRYRRGGRHQTYQYVTKSMDVLLKLGLIEHELGIWNHGRAGKQSVAWPTDELVELLEPVIAAGELERSVQATKETIVLRDRADKKVIDYTDTADTDRMRAEVEILNQELSKLTLIHQGQQFAIPTGRRVFNGDFTRGGRFYCHGPSFQNIPAQQRGDLQLVIDGVTHPMIEIDYCNLHAVMAYAEAGKPMPSGDQYDIEGFDRGLVKIAFNILLNATTRNLGISAIAEKLHTDDALREACHLTTSSRRPCRALSKNVVLAIEDKHREIESYFGSDCGARFQRQDSVMAVQVMLRMIKKTGRCPLPMHDSFLVADIDRDVLAETMREVASENGLPLHLKDSQGQKWEPVRSRRGWGLSFHKEVINTHLGKQEKAQTRQNADRDHGHGVFGDIHIKMSSIWRRIDQRGPPVAGCSAVHAADKARWRLSGALHISSRRQLPSHPINTIATFGDNHEDSNPRPPSFRIPFIECKVSELRKGPRTLRISTSAAWVAEPASGAQSADPYRASKRLFTNRVAWALTHMTQAGLLTPPQRGRYLSLSAARGSSTTTQTVDLSVLAQFPAHQEFRSRKSGPKTGDTETSAAGELSPSGAGVAGPGQGYDRARSFLVLLVTVSRASRRSGRWPGLRWRGVRRRGRRWRPWTQLRRVRSAGRGRLRRRPAGW